MKIRNLLFATCMAIPLTSLADNRMKPPPTADTVKATKLSKAEIVIVAHVHHVNLMEIQLGKQAQKQGTAAVKRYGEMLVRDHQTADEELIAMAKRHGVAKIPADKPQNEADKADRAAQQAAMKKLRTLEGEEFDRAFLQEMVLGHEKELDKSDPAITIAQVPALKTMLESRKTMLQRHAETARELQKGNAQASVDPSKTAPKPAK